MNKEFLMAIVIESDKGDNMVDTLIRTITNDNNFRVIALEATDLMNVANKFHDATTLGTEILGRALLSSLLVSNAVLKGDERLAVVIDGKGPAGRVVVEANATGEVRGYVENPRVQVPLNAKGGQDVATAVGNDGMVSVTKQMEAYSEEGGNHVEQYTGSVELLSGRIDDDLTYYMIKSEQIDSVVMVSVDVQPDGTVKSAGGFIVSALPDASKEALDAFYEQAKNLGDMSVLLAKGDGPVAIVKALFGDAIKVLSTTEVNLFPSITKREYARMLMTLPLEQLQELLEDDHGVEIVDKFTGEAIQFDASELQVIIGEKAAEGLN